METKCAENNIQIHKDFADGQVLVNVDSELIEQVIVNIIKNAAESIGQKGDIYCKTSSSPAILEIADTGEGISDDTQKKLFSPFFSTKPNGQGIGLIFIREVLNKHNCHFSLKTYADGITRFRIEFVKIK
jgi:Signal transduction histidine kinase regulating C4-dicarboxylate transport system